ncbi:MAG: hypothetical protein AAF468_19985 [Pseudomonadota bacterium]
MGEFATRLVDHPIIHAGLHETVGDNINGPSLIRVPDWVERPLGRCYLYFAHHMGDHIRLAYADALTGPWTVHPGGVLSVAESGFVAVDPPQPPRDQWPDWALSGDRLNYAHVASPDVHVDGNNQTISMYLHGLLPNGDQMTRLAVSSDGLQFEVREPLLGPPYFRVFRHGEFFYAIAFGGALLRARSPEGPFETGPDIFAQMPIVGDGQLVRHAAVRVAGDTLSLFFTRIGDTPERILVSRVELAEDWSDWVVHLPSEVLKPELGWEGADDPIVCSSTGAAHGLEHALRDPCIFEKDGKTYMLYCGGGEQGIGICGLR